MNRYGSSFAKFLLLCILSALSAMFVMTGAGCGGNEGGEGEGAAVAQELRLMVEGEEVVVSLEGMDIYLVEHEETYPETFEIRGNGVLLVGEFPMDLHVGYGSELKLLEGREIALLARGGEHGEDLAATLKLPDREPQAVKGGWFMVEETSGPRRGLKGDGVIAGKISIELGGEFETQTLEGTFTLVPTTWG